MTIVRVFGAIFALLAVFLFGMGLPHNPSGFPIGRKLVAVSLNGQPVVRQDTGRRPQFDV